MGGHSIWNCVPHARPASAESMRTFSPPPCRPSADLEHAVSIPQTPDKRQHCRPQLGNRLREWSGTVSNRGIHTYQLLWKSQLTGQPVNDCPHNSPDIVLRYTSDKDLDSQQPDYPTITSGRFSPAGTARSNKSTTLFGTSPWPNNT